MEILERCFFIYNQLDKEINKIEKIILCNKFNNSHTETLNKLKGKRDQLTCKVAKRFSKGVWNVTVYYNGCVEIFKDGVFVTETNYKNLTALKKALETV